jgi:FtsP/CotA-like multicopper oxidase with cupredoxin domain
VWSDYKPNYWTINGRCYPDTVQPNTVGGNLKSQPISSLIQVNAGDSVLLRFVNLGYEQHAMQPTGIPMKVIGEDATFLGGAGTGSAAYSQPNRVDISYFTNTLYIGPS